MADVLSGESLPELFSLPEFGGHLRRGNELVTRDALTSGALASGIVGS
ncbi:MAG: hypothetical protein ACRDRS_12990 [Pseudonocardiaceae bacterium]